MFMIWFKFKINYGQTVRHRFILNTNLYFVICFFVVADTQLKSLKSPKNINRLICCYN